MSNLLSQLTYEHFLKAPQTDHLNFIGFFDRYLCSLHKNDYKRLQVLLISLYIFTFQTIEVQELKIYDS